VLAVISAGAVSAGGREAGGERLKGIYAMLLDLRAESRIDAARIRAAYAEHAARAWRSRDDLLEALAQGELRFLPHRLELFNVAPRLSGRWPIGERDLQHQHLYLAARPAALGCLAHIAARVSGGPIEVTSLVRHRDYQSALQRTNVNAKTDLPMHTLGLAFDISVVNATLETARELRDVLRRMRQDGDLFFIAETRQFVLHVVPTPERATFYSDLFEGLLVLEETWLERLP
jgi:hypothetical protein